MSALFVLIALLCLVPVVHGLWVLAYGLGPRRVLDQRLKDYANRD